MSLEAARTRARVRAAYVAECLPAAGAPTLMGYEVLPIGSVTVRKGTLQDIQAHELPAGAAAGDIPPLLLADER